MRAKARRLGAERVRGGARAGRGRAAALALRWLAALTLRSLAALTLWSLAASLAALAWMWPARALAHQVGLSRGEYSVAGALVTAELTFAQREIAGLVGEADRDRNDALTDAEMEAGREALARVLVGGLVVEGDGVACPGKLDSARVVEADGVTLKLSYTCAAPPAEVRFDLALLEELELGHRHIFRGGVPPKLTEAILFRKKRSIEVLTRPASAPGAAQPAAEGPAPPDAPAAEAAPSSSLDLFLMGIEHILLGFDHLVFLLGVVLVGGRWRSILLVVTAFTLAHSITLALATLGVWAPSPRIIEPAIALSIAYVGVENYFVNDAEGRWRITLPFGLVHGFGFAGALQEVGLPQGDVPRALLLFNLGVEAGQVAVLALVLPLLAAARKREWLTPRAVKLASALIVAAGLAWFVERIASG